MIERKICVLPDPLSPTTPRLSPSPIVNADVIGREHLAVGVSRSGW